MKIETKFDTDDSVCLKKDVEKGEMNAYRVAGIKFSDKKGTLYDLAKISSGVLAHANIAEHALLGEKEACPRVVH